MPSKRVSPSSSGTSRMRSRSSPFATSRTSAPRPPRKRPWPSRGSARRGLLREAPNRLSADLRHPRDRRMPVLASAGLMFLKSLTLRGFKSFAEKTTLDFEPGITVIVGPNGSGKSNVVDAIAWVLGEQGPKSLRGGKMQDVIFAGTGSRGALGRAEVALTIDNSAGLLSIEYTEVTVTRHLYRSGESEYAINGTLCRLLDIQELLSDTGVGRELHTVLGQNRLEDVLQGRPEDRRAAIEEAAGVYKHRRRKEKALRELAGVRERSASLDAEEAAFAARLAELEQRHDAEEARECALQAELADLEPAAARATDAVHRLATVRERLKGTVALAEARARHLAESLATEPEGRSMADLEREAAEVAEELAAVEAELAATAATASEAAAERDRARAALAAFDQAAARAERDRAAAHRREVRLASEVAGLERTIEQMEAETGRLRAQTAALEQRRTATATQVEGSRAERAALVSEQSAREADRRSADARRDELATTARRLAAEERRVEADRAAARARREAYEATARAAGGDALAFLEGAGRDGILGPLAPTLSVDPGYEAAVAAALGPDADAIVVADPAVAASGAHLLRDAGSGRAILLHPKEEGGPDRGTPAEARSSLAAEPAAGPRTGRVADAREVGPGLSTGGAGEAREEGPGLSTGSVLLERVAMTGVAGEVAGALLDGVLVADDLDQARELLELHPGRRVVTLAGELLAAGRVEGGVVPEASGLAARRAAEEAAKAEAAAAAALEQVGAELRAAQEELEGAERRAADATRALRDAQAAVRRLDDRATMIDKELRGLEREAATGAERLHELDSGRERTAV